MAHPKRMSHIFLLILLKYFSDLKTDWDANKRKERAYHHTDLKTKLIRSQGSVADNEKNEGLAMTASVTIPIS